MPKKLSPAAVSKGLKSLKGWTAAGDEISKTFSFEDYYETMAFVNAVAWIANSANHHPDMEVHYNKVKVRYSTHDAGGVTKDDLDNAKAVNGLL
jgi:4a-hydroxytetrahydrobiopterin dehydratase